MKKSLVVGMLVYLISHGLLAYDPIKTRKVDRNPNFAPLRQIDLAIEVQIPRHQQIQTIKNLTE